MRYSSNHGNLAVKVKPFPSDSEAAKMAPKSKLAISRKGAPYKIVFQGYIFRSFINYVIWFGGRGGGQKMMQDDKGEGRGLERSEKR